LSAVGIAAWQMGNDDLRHMSYGRMEPSGRDLTSAGRVLGMVATGIFVIQNNRHPSVFDQHFVDKA